MAAVVDVVEVESVVELLDNSTNPTVHSLVEPIQHKLRHGFLNSTLRRAV